MEELEKKSTVSIINDMTILDEQIELLILRYNRLCNEINRRHPQTKEETCFKPKVLRR